MNLSSPRLPQSLSTRIGAVILAVVVAASIAIVGVRHFTGLPGNAALEFDGTVVTRTELTDRAHLLGALYGVEKPKGKAAQATFNRDVAKAVAVSMILDKAARAHDIVISDKSSRDTLAAMVKAQMGDDPETAFTSLLGEFGVSENDVLGELKRQQSIARLFRVVTKDAVAKATPSAVRAYFDQDPSRFAVPEQRTLSNIVVASRKDATVLLTRAHQGTSFASLARSSSLDDATRDKDGALGTVTASQLDPTFARAAFTTADGDLFGPVKSQFGWNVGIVRKVVPGRAASFASVADQVTDALRSKLGLVAWRAWLAREIKDAHVRYADAYRPAHPDAAPSDSSVGPNAATPAPDATSAP
ncbi:MAG: Peptidylprolyl isomerase [Aeromicrobium sp.]|nr:Peptidylprolyl isomerase [Aeromicrobium sp.]